MKSEKLDRRIEIQSATDVQNEYGAVEKTYTTTASTYAQIEFKTGSEDFLNGVEVDTQGVVFVIRYRPNISVKDRIVLDGVSYDIIQIKEIKRREIQEIQCNSID